MNILMFQIREICWLRHSLALYVFCLGIALIRTAIAQVGTDNPTIVGNPAHPLPREYQRTSVPRGAVLASNPGKDKPIYEPIPIIDVRDKAVDCTGTTDSSAALNALTGDPPRTDNAITGMRLVFPLGCQVAAKNTWFIKNQASFTIDGLVRNGANQGGPTIKCVSGGTCSGGIQVDMEYVDGFEWTGVALSGNGLATVGLNIDKTGGGGILNTTDGRVHDAAFRSAGTQSWTGVQISNVSTSNVEDIRIENSSFACASRPGNAAQYGIVIGASMNAKNEVIRHNNFTTCFYAVWKKQGNFFVSENEFSSNGGTCRTGTGADIRDDGSSDIDVIEWNLDENGTQFLNEGNGSAPNLPFAVNVNYNHSAPAGCENTSVYWIDAEAVVNEFHDNSWDRDVNLIKVIGSDWSNLGSGHVLNESGNIFPNSIYDQWWTTGWYYGISDSVEATLGNRLLQQTVTNSGAFPSPFWVWRGFLKGGAGSPDDWAIQAIPFNGLTSTFLIKHQQGSIGTSFFAPDAAYPGITINQVANPGAPGIAVRGVPGNTAYTYAVVAYYGNANTAGSPTTTTHTGNAALSTNNYNQLQFTGTAGVTKYCIWRTAGGATQGKIGCISALQNSGSQAAFGYGVNSLGVNNYYQFNDNGLTGDNSPLPNINTTGTLTLSAIRATGKAVCVKSDKSLGYCSTQPDASGNCTCN